MQIDVIEFALVCPIHGEHNILVPAEFPRPVNCAHCFLRATSRREVRRFSVGNGLPNALGSEAFLG